MDTHITIVIINHYTNILLNPQISLDFNIPWKIRKHYPRNATIYNFTDLRDRLTRASKPTPTRYIYIYILISRGGHDARDNPFASHRHACRLCGPNNNGGSSGHLINSIGHNYRARGNRVLITSPGKDSAVLARYLRANNHFPAETAYVRVINGPDSRQTIDPKINAQKLSRDIAFSTIVFRFSFFFLRVLADEILGIERICLTSCAMGLLKLKWKGNIFDVSIIRGKI